MLPTIIRGVTLSCSITQLGTGGVQNPPRDSYANTLQLGHEPRCEKTSLQGFRPGPIETGLYSHRSKQESCNFGYK